MKVYTFQLAKWRKVKALEIPYLNTTVKSGEWRLAPTWELLTSYRAGLTDDEGYTTVFNALMEERYIKEPKYFEAIFNKGTIAFACYCPKGKFCHRHLLVKFFSTKTNVEMCGEID